MKQPDGFHQLSRVRFRFSCSSRLLLRAHHEIIALS